MGADTGSVEAAHEEAGEFVVVLLKNRRWEQTAVSNAFIDGYMADANGEFVKVYLYLLRLLSDEDREFSVSFLADRLNNTEKDVIRALSYWEKLNLLELQYGADGKLNGITVLDVPFSEPEDASSLQAEQIPQVPAAEEETAAAIPAEAPERHVSCSLDFLKKIQKDDDFQEVIFAAERYLGRTMSAKDVELFGYMKETLKFPNDLIEYLIEYCVDGGHRSCRYMESVALGWHSDGILTLQQAKEANRAFKKENKAIMKAFGITGRVLAPEERKFLNIWLREDRMPLPVVVEACNRTMRAIHSPSFEYADKIVKAWKSAGITTADAANAFYERQKAERKKPEKTAALNRFHNFDQRDTDYDALLMQEEKELYGANKSTV